MRWHPCIAFLAITGTDVSCCDVNRCVPRLVLAGAFRLELRLVSALTGKDRIQNDKRDQNNQDDAGVGGGLHHLGKGQAAPRASVEILTTIKAPDLLSLGRLYIVLFMNVAAIRATGIVIPGHYL